MRPVPSVPLAERPSLEEAAARDSANPRHLEFIDALRGIAILMVILIHTSESIPGLPAFIADLAHLGMYGVQLFFVASAYTLCRTMAIRRRESARLLYFYLRRFFRIAPLYYLAIPLYFAVHLLMQYGEPELVHMGPYTKATIAANVLFIHGFVPWAYNHVVPGGWSIGTEMAFYAIFPLTYVLARNYHSKTGKAPVRLVLYAVLINAVAQLLLHRYTSWGSYFFVYCNLVNQLPVFAVGIVLFFHHKSSMAGTQGPRGRASFAPAASLLLLAAVASSGREVQVWSYLVAPLLFALAFAACLDYMYRIGFSSRVLCAIGRASYSMYIVHFLFAWYGLRLLMLWLPPVDATAATASLVIGYFVAVGLSYLLAHVTEKYVERSGIALGAQVIAWLEAHRTVLSRTRP
jgi:peptidoglycan/LPS O-acetylase OafA/YrhL